MLCSKPTFNALQSKISWHLISHPPFEMINAKDEPLIFHSPPIFIAPSYLCKALQMSANSSSAAEAILIAMEAARKFNKIHTNHPEFQTNALETILPSLDWAYGAVMEQIPSVFTCQKNQEFSNDAAGQHTKCLLLFPLGGGGNKTNCTKQSTNKTVIRQLTKIITGQNLVADCKLNLDKRNWTFSRLWKSGSPQRSFTKQSGCSKMQPQWISIVPHQKKYLTGANNSWQAGTISLKGSPYPWSELSVGVNTSVNSRIQKINFWIA